MDKYDEFELIAHPRLPDCALFAVDLIYRPVHFHNELELCYVVRGTGRAADRQGSYDIGTGDLLLFDSGAPHEIAAMDANGIRLLAVQISRSFCKRYFPRILNIGFCQCLLTPQIRPEVVQKVRSCIREAFLAYFSAEETDIFTCVAMLNLLFRQLLVSAPHQVLTDQQMVTRNRKAERLRRLLHYMEEHFREPIRLRDLAEMEGLTETHLSHFFREELHISFQEYLSQIRLEAAMTLLRSTTVSVTDAAYSCGFSDPKYLNRSFQRNLHTTPREWRARESGADAVNYPRNLDTLQRILSRGECMQLLQQMYEG